MGTYDFSKSADINRCEGSTRELLVVLAAQCYVSDEKRQKLTCVCVCEPAYKT